MTTQGSSMGTEVATRKSANVLQGSRWRSGAGELLAGKHGGGGGFMQAAQGRQTSPGGGQWMKKCSTHGA